MKRNHWTSLAVCAAFCGALLLGSAPPSHAKARQDAPEQTEEADAKKKSRREAKEARIAEYLRKREERRIRRDQRALEQEVTRKATLEEAERKRQEDAQTDEIRKVEKAHAAEVAAAERAARNGGKAPGRMRGSKLPRGLARAQEAVRNSRLGQDPTVQGYLDLVEEQKASAQQLAAVGNFLGQAGMGNEALEYYGVALRLDKKDPVLWINTGTLHRQAGRTGQAISAYGKALSLDRNNAVAHYNLGACFDDLGKYEDAIQAYMVALRLDPTLGDPAINPQAANNEHLTAVKLRLYQEQSGSLGIPLINVPGGQLQASDNSSN